jgi:cardiolipin synthase A/B
MPEWLESAWPHVTSAVVLGATAVAVWHVVLNKRDVRAAIGWAGLIVLLPGIGTLLYVVLGVNRIERRASRLRTASARRAPTGEAVVGRPPRGQAAHAGDVDEVGAAEAAGDGGASDGGGAGALPATVGASEVAARVPSAPHLAQLALLVDRTSRRSLVAGNAVRALLDGDEAYPAMLEAIGQAKSSIALETYIFDADDVGRKFADALAEAKARGVEVRVLIDDAGARYSRPPIDRMLRRRGVQTARFLPVLLPWALPYMNLRNHRKVLIVDGTRAFTGGMNIRGGCVLADAPRHPTRDLHFSVEGPVVRQLMEIFAHDWRFAADERLDGTRWFPTLEPRGDVLARGIADGPDEDLDAMRWTMLGAIASARRSLRLVTPYFLPDEALVTALNVAAMRGVEVDVVLPARGNLRVVEWAMWGEIWKVLGRGCRVWLTPPPFDHSKLLVVDGAWTLLGSANWDPRSLRLNFELGMECYDAELGRRADLVVDSKVGSARRLEEEDLLALSGAARLRNGLARLLTPYL